MTPVVLRSHTSYAIGQNYFVSSSWELKANATGVSSFHVEIGKPCNLLESVHSLEDSSSHNNRRWNSAKRPMHYIISLPCVTPGLVEEKPLDQSVHLVCNAMRMYRYPFLCLIFRNTTGSHYNAHIISCCSRGPVIKTTGRTTVLSW